MKVYMQVTKDKYRLPMVVADSCAELAELCGTTIGTIYTQICLWRKGNNPRSRYICGEVDVE